MFRKDGRVWLYLIGIILMFFAIAYFTSNYYFPFLQNGGRFNFLNDSYPKPDFTISSNKSYSAKFFTNYGTFIAQLYPKAAPINVNNFVYLSNKGYYTNTRIHRIIPEFLIQGGDRSTITGDISTAGRGRLSYLLADEVNWDSLDLPEDKRTVLKNAGYKSTPGLESKHLERFSLAMANNGPNTNSSQFFIITSSIDDPRLKQYDGYFTVIGKVVSGGEVVQEISQIQVDNPTSNSPRPLKDIIIQKVEISEN